MKTFTTKIKAINPKTGELFNWFGPDVQAETKEEAQKYCDENGLGYCEVHEELVMEIPFHTAEFASKLNDKLN